MISELLMTLLALRLNSNSSEMQKQSGLIVIDEKAAVLNPQSVHCSINGQTSTPRNGHGVHQIGE